MIKKIEEVGIISVADAARQLGISRQVAHNRIKKEGIPIIIISGRMTAVMQSDLARLAGKRKLGRPEKKIIATNPENS